MLNTMLCGASDLSDYILDYFVETCNEMGLTPLNYLKGNIYYRNYGNSPWQENSKLTVNNAELIIFVIEEKYGQITWNIEFEEAYSNGKNFIFLCNSKVFSIYRNANNYNLEINETNKNIVSIINGLKRLESTYQITIIPYEVKDFKNILKQNIALVFRDGLLNLEQQNRKNKFLPILLSSKFNDLPEEHINETNTKLTKEILFDFFEKKEVRKRAMEYFYISKSLSETEIIDLCLDSEQGINRKAVANISKLINQNSNIERIFSEVITSISNEEVGVIRRAIVSFIEVDLKLSIKYFGSFFPTSDVGIPRRIISELYQYKSQIEMEIKKDIQFKQDAFELFTKSINYNSEKTPWKEQAKELLEILH